MVIIMEAVSQNDDNNLFKVHFCSDFTNNEIKECYNVDNQLGSEQDLIDYYQFEEYSSGCRVLTTTGEVADPTDAQIWYSKRYNKYYTNDEYYDTIRDAKLTKREVFAHFKVTKLIMKL